MLFSFYSGEPYNRVYSAHRHLLKTYLCPARAMPPHPDTEMSKPLVWPPESSVFVASPPGTDFTGSLEPRQEGLPGEGSRGSAAAGEGSVAAADTRSAKLPHEAGAAQDLRSPQTCLLLRGQTPSLSRGERALGEARSLRPGPLLVRNWGQSSKGACPRCCGKMPSWRPGPQPPGAAPAGHAPAVLQPCAAGGRPSDLALSWRVDALCS